LFTRTTRAQGGAKISSEKRWSNFLHLGCWVD